MPAFHELIFDERKMSDIQSLSLGDLIPERNFELKPITGAIIESFWFLELVVRLGLK